MPKLFIIGTSHVADESVQKVLSSIEEKNPDIVALELDHARLHGLIHETKQGVSVKDIPSIGLQGYLFALLAGFVQRKIGKSLGIMPGSEMKNAFLAARKQNKKIVLIDQDVRITLSRLSKILTWREKFRMLKSVFFSAIFRKDEIMDLAVDIDVSKVPSSETIEKMLRLVKKIYPGIHLVLVEERNIYMAKKLAQLLRDDPATTILAVVGKGHEKEIARVVNEYLKGPAS